MNKELKMEKDHIWVITMIPPEKIDGIYQHSRCFGFFYNLGEAQKYVETAGQNLCEYYYDYAVIEEKREGVYGGFIIGAKEFWYKWNEKKQNYFKCRKPKRFKSVVCFGMG